MQNNTLKIQLIKILLMFFVIHFTASTTAAADVISDNTVKELISEIKELRKNNENLKTELETIKKEQAEIKKNMADYSRRDHESKTPSGAASNALSDLEKELNSAASGDIQKGAKTTAQNSLGMAGATNPDMGAVGIISYTAAKKYEDQGGTPAANTFQFDEAELNIAGYVDPFHKYDLVLGFHEDEVGVEEAYLTKFDLPLKLAGRLGKFRSSIGFINQHHVDELPWAGEHVFLNSFLGEEGLVTTGLELKKTFSSKGRWTPTLSYELGSGHEYDKTAATGTPNKLAMHLDKSFARDRRNLIRLRNHFDINEKKDFTLGLSYLDSDHGDLKVLGADFQYRYRPQSYQGLSFIGEFLKRDDKSYNLKRAAAGLNSFSPQGYMLNLEYQWDPVWKAGAVYSNFDDPARINSGKCDSKIVYIAHPQTEFTRYLLQYEQREMAGFEKDNRLTMQLIFNTGYHRHKLK